MTDETLLAYRMQVLENAVIELREAHKSIAHSLQQLVLLEHRHAETREALSRAFTSIGDCEDRLSPIEQELPKLRMVCGWVLSLVLACTVAAGTLVWKRVTDATIVPFVERRGGPLQPQAKD